MSVLSALNLRKSFGDKKAVDDISLSVQKNEIVGLLGPNGAGKTTTINMILGILKPDSGTVTIGGYDIGRQRRRALMNTNFAAAYAPLPGNLTVRQNLKIFSMMYSIPRSAARIDEVIDLFDLKDMADKKLGLLSSGQQTRAGLAKAFLNKPRLLLLDEPTASLDPATARDIRDHIKRFAHNGDSAVLWTSHNMNEVEDVCDRVLFVSRGKILMEGNPRTLPGLHKQQSLEDLFVAIAREPLTTAEAA